MYVNRSYLTQAFVRAALTGLLFFNATFGASLAQAAARLVVWQPTPDAPRIILPAIDNETVEQSVTRYLHSVHRDKQLRTLAPEQIARSIFKSGEFLAEPQSTKVLTALIANEFSDLTAEGERIQRNLRVFDKKGANSYVVALSADIGLGKQDAADFGAQIAEKFDLLVAMGGDDLAPEIYGEEVTYATANVAVRDYSELKIVKIFKERARGFFFGICRGHQLGAIIDGHSLFQDLSKDGVANTADHVNVNGRIPREEQRWHPIVILDSLLQRFVQKAAMLVNSLHHQAVRVNPRAASRPIAWHDGINEGLQQNNGKGISLQFHAEFPEDVSGDAAFSAEGEKIIGGVIAMARLNRMQERTANGLAQSCREVQLAH